jgi:hypothetical protein
MKNIKEVCEPAVSYATDCMTVDEYIGKIKKALDARYQNKMIIQ